MEGPNSPTFRVPTPGSIKRPRHRLQKAVRAVPRGGDAAAKHFLDAGVGIGFAHIGLHESLLQHYGTRLLVVEDVIYEWRVRANWRLDPGHDPIEIHVKKAANKLLACHDEWNIMEIDLQDNDKVKQIQRQIDPGKGTDDSNRIGHRGEAASILVALRSDAVVLSNDGGAYSQAKELGVVCRHAGHVLREMVVAGMITAPVALSYAAQIHEVSGIGFDYPSGPAWFACT